ncbi:MAG: hypothetical protein Q4C30_07130 [Bacteroidia bacterium]|nr:hypothetical protein [Bacteroidia bacterium]
MANRRDLKKNIAFMADDLLTILELKFQLENTDAEKTDAIKAKVFTFYNDAISAISKLKKKAEFAELNKNLTEQYTNIVSEVAELK